MSLTAWPVLFGVVLLLGVIVGVLARFLLTLLAVLVVLGALGIAALGILDPALLAQIPELLGRVVSGLPFSPTVLFTVGALVFLVGVLAGVLLTTPLRGLARARPFP